MTRVSSGLLGALLLAASASPGVAQSVRGLLRDADHGRAIPGARLRLLADGGASVDSARSDGEGRFRLTASAAGTYLVAFEMDGWAGSVSEPLVLAAGEVTDLDFRVPLVATAALQRMHDIMRMEPRLQSALPEICGEAFRPWEAGLLVGVVRQRATNGPVPGARVAVAVGAGDVVRSTLAGETGVFVLCNVPVGAAVRITVEPPGGPAETTEVEIRAGTASWFDLEVGPPRPGSRRRAGFTIALQAKRPAGYAARPASHRSRDNRSD